MLLLCLTVLNASAQKTASDEVKRLQTRMYKLYSGYDYDEFISVTDSLLLIAIGESLKNLDKTTDGKLLHPMGLH